MSLAAYDAGLLKYLRGALAFDNIINSADTQAFSNTADKSDKGIQIHLPMISFWRTGNPLANDSVGNFHQRHVGWRINKDTENLKSDRLRSLPISIQYQITIWSDNRNEVDDIFRELMMYLIHDNPRIKVELDGLDNPLEFSISVMDTDFNTDLDSFDDKGRIYSTNIMVEIQEAQLIFSKSTPLTRDITIRTITMNTKDPI